MIADESMRAPTRQMLSAGAIELRKQLSKPTPVYWEHVCYEVWQAMISAALKGGKDG